MPSLRALILDDRGSPAAETVLVLPILFALIFGPLEVGNYFLSEHKVVKAVRDGARFAARRSFADYPSCTPTTQLIDDTRNVTRTGIIAEGGTPRLGTWTDPTSIEVEVVSCDPAGTYTGIYLNPDAPGVPVVRVSATVPYQLVLGDLGLTDATLTLRAHSEATVTGI
jgi:hypothetical protein